MIGNGSSTSARGVRLLRFAVLGDTHFVAPGRPARPGPGARSSATLAHYERLGHTLWPRVVEEVRAAAPDLAVQVGDLVEGGYTDGMEAAAEMAEAVARLEQLGCPVLVAQGNHDRHPTDAAVPAWRDVVLPWVGRCLGWSRAPQHEYYVLDRAGCRFLLLGPHLRPGDPQHRWLEGLLAHPDRGQRCFAFGHLPLVPLARPAFSSYDYATAVGPALAAAGCEAYFCAHTHNQCVSLHHYPAGPLLQVKGSAVGTWPGESHPLGRGPLPLSSLRALYPGPFPYEYYWGYLEHTAPGWYLVDVLPEEVTLTWHLAGHGPQARLSWSHAGVVTVVEPPPPAPLPRMEPGDFARAVAARLRLAGYGAARPGKTVWLNGVAIGELPPLRSFDTAGTIEIPAAGLAGLRLENEVAFQTAAGEAALFGAVLLEADLADGRRVRTRVSPWLWATCTATPGDAPVAWASNGWFGNRLIWVQPGATVRGVRLAWTPRDEAQAAGTTAGGVRLPA